MSVYSGFGTRQQESTYSKALYNTLFLLQLRIYKLFKGGKYTFSIASGCKMRCGMLLIKCSESNLLIEYREV